MEIYDLRKKIATQLKRLGIGYDQKLSNIYIDIQSTWMDSSSKYDGFWHIYALNTRECECENEDRECEKLHYNRDATPIEIFNAVSEFIIETALNKKEKKIETEQVLNLLSTIPSTKEDEI